MPIRPEARSAKTEAHSKHYLRFDGPNLTIFYGPFPAEEIVKRYYDPYGRWMDEHDTLDSTVLSNKQVEILAAIEGNVFATPEQWHRAHVLAVAAGHNKQEEDA